MLARRELRLLIVRALEVARIGAVVDSPGDWDAVPERLPVLFVRSGKERKVSHVRAAPQFTTTPVFELRAIVEASEPRAALDRIEDLADRIEGAIFGNVALVAKVQYFPEVASEILVTAEGQRHVGSFSMALAAETFESFEPFVPDTLAEIDVHADMAAPYDASGTYPAPTAPPYTPAAAPRTSGPDGRDEGALKITLPT